MSSYYNMQVSYLLLFYSHWWCVLFLFERGNQHVLARTLTGIVSVVRNNSLEPILFITMRVLN
jgi:hypothetical protein